MSERTSIYTWVRFIVGAIMFMALLFIYAFVKEFPFWVMGMPGLLMGVDPVAIIRGIKK